MATFYKVDMVGTCKESKACLTSKFPPKNVLIYISYKYVYNKENLIQKIVLSTKNTQEQKQKNS